MARLAPKLEVVRALFARSGNQCAFPGCTQPLVSDNNKFIGQICHIEAAMPKGERYNESQSDEDRRAYENLILFCYPHHIETDDVDEYTVDILTKIKLEHELLFEKSDFKIDESALRKLVNEMDAYWSDIERLNGIDHSFEELAFKVDANGSFFDVINSAREATDWIEELLNRLHKSDCELPEDFNVFISKHGVDPKIFEDVSYSSNPFELRNWEDHNLATPNWLQRLRIDLTHIEVKYLEEYLKTNNSDLVARDRLKQVKVALAELAQHAIHVD
jgi:hypothetical protein